ncbi:MAG: hypothetical protein L6408_02565 [Nanoarchaeota archaeon]|nr:hypothetical protein [Nanoarchaeota archaeon]
MANAFVTKIQKLWKNVENEYREDMINSEHALQCVMYRQLREWTDEERLTIFVEPAISPSGQESPFRPDFLIVKNNTVEYVIELKYWPQNFVPFEPDWRKFYWWNLKQQKKVKVGINKIEKKEFDVNIKAFIFAYIDKGGGAISTKEKVLNFVNKENRRKSRENWRKSFSKEIYGEEGMKNLDWMKGKYIQAHGDGETWEVFLV